MGEAAPVRVQGESPSQQTHRLDCLLSLWKAQGGISIVEVWFLVSYLLEHTSLRLWHESGPLPHRPVA